MLNQYQSKLEVEMQPNTKEHRQVPKNERKHIKETRFQIRQNDIEDNTKHSLQGSNFTA